MARGRAHEESLGRTQKRGDSSEETPMPSWDTLPLAQSPAGAVPQWFVGALGEWSTAAEPAEAAASAVRDLEDPCRWGLSAEATATVGARLDAFWLRCRDCFTTRKRDTSPHASTSLRGQLTMD